MCQLKWAFAAPSQNIGALLNYKHYYFIPMAQDDPIKKPVSVVCDFDRTLETVKYALEGKQLGPVLI